MTNNVSSNPVVDLSELAVKVAQVLDALDGDRAYDLLLIKQSDEWTLVAKATASGREAGGQLKIWRIKASLA